MLKRWMHRWVRGLETRFDYDATYLHEMVDVAPGAVLKLALIQPLSQHRAGVSRAAWHAARIVAARHEDCGPCAQLVLDMALADGVPVIELRAIAAGDFDTMSRDAALGAGLADAVCRRSDLEPARAAVLARFGEAGLIALACAIAGARVFPTLKRSLGHARACGRLRVAGDLVEGAWT